MVEETLEKSHLGEEKLALVLSNPSDGISSSGCLHFGATVRIDNNKTGMICHPRLPSEVKESCRGGRAQTIP